MTSPVAINTHDVSPAFTDIFLPAPIIPASAETFLCLYLLYIAFDRAESRNPRGSRQFAGDYMLEATCNPWRARASQERTISEPMAVMIIGLGYSLKMGTKIGFKLVKA
jgi:hypothetical protein